ncbi:hypothetical protein AAX05_03225 [Moraxella bovoculi]|uniref:DUF1294 domain-containing protein n=1 Tax=Moraxella bovoculi TaxID=386891 RepID=A0AAC8PX57_9GAMM|nr:DUF1294 domain-containing protein [Moraxella bovoculi]AKG08097.1 hypothetical protein AAX06_08015 [Moraxella bovoculi]AKG09348.1 hypothetical protein AAX05_03225 [Moraxella bovoculi]AKG11181.1 hypothetical protein AAX07_03260 [Moraxella bovoculi]AKG13174.1 hypothetical protein AAX11_02975 [Moraxella bovoculi]
MARQKRAPRSILACYIATGYLAIVAILIVIGVLPWMVAAIHGVTSLVSYGMYALDKQAAKNRERRIAEYSLYLWSLLGSWIGAAFSQHQLRHKTQKEELQLTFYPTTIANIAAMVYLFLIEPY